MGRALALALQRVSLPCQARVGACCVRWYRDQFQYEQRQHAVSMTVERHDSICGRMRSRGRIVYPMVFSLSLLLYHCTAMNIHCTRVHTAGPAQKCCTGRWRAHDVIAGSPANAIRPGPSCDSCACCHSAAATVTEGKDTRARPWTSSCRSRCPANTLASRQDASSTVAANAVPVRITPRLLLTVHSLVPGGSSGACGGKPAEAV